jgi:hypothetical protein
VWSEYAPFNGGFRTPRGWVGWTSSTSGTYTGSSGYSYCLQSRARDGAFNLSGMGGWRCTAVPVDDRSLAASSGWTRYTSSHTYLGTFTYSTRQGATLTLSGVEYKNLAIVVTRCNTCGTVDVLAGGTLLKRISTYYSGTAFQQILPVASRSSLSPATTITIRISSSGRPVYIDGLAVGAF